MKIIISIMLLVLLITPVVSASSWYFDDKKTKEWKSNVEYGSCEHQITKLNKEIMLLKVEIERLKVGYEVKPSENYYGGTTVRLPTYSGERSCFTIGKKKCENVGLYFHNILTNIFSTKVVVECTKYPMQDNGDLEGYNPENIRLRFTRSEKQECKKYSKYTI